MSSHEGPVEVVWMRGTAPNLCEDEIEEDSFPLETTFVPDVHIKAEPVESSSTEEEEEDPESSSSEEDYQPKPSKSKPKSKGKSKPPPVKKRVRTKSKDKPKHPRQCTICLKIIRKKTDMQDHLESHSTVKDHECPLCKKMYSKKALRFHMLEHNKTFQCTICGYGFTNRAKYETHVTRHQNQLQHDCPDCDKRFNRPVDLKLHMTKVHAVAADPGPLMYKCPKCDWQTRQLFILKDHLQSKHGEGFVCKICDKTFKYARTLQNHMVTHNVEDLKEAGEKLHACSMCHKNFIQLSYLKAHLQIHDKDPEKKKKKKYPCPDCEQVFPTILLLNDHLAEHTGTGEQFNCTKCEESFADGKKLKIHYQKAHVQKDQCLECGKMTVNMSTHLNRYHSGKDS